MSGMVIVDDEFHRFEENGSIDPLDWHLPELENYQIAEQLYVGTHTLVYRGTRQPDGYPVIIKILRSLFPDLHELVQFRNQYTIAKNLNSERIIQPLAIENCGNRAALILEDFGGIPLSSYLQRDGKPIALPIAEFLDIALQLVDALHYLYLNRVIHKDIKPANILIEPETKQVKLTDFSISSLLPSATPELQTTNVLEGTLAYISPEQTGRMNRGIDYRSDYYSLGVTFHQLLTGQLPFSADDPLASIHCHLAKQPTPTYVLNTNVPIGISRIVSKLMSKNAEDRYQHALGLKHDLEICQRQLKSTGEIIEFDLGTKDLTDRFLIPEKLYGREYETNVLLNAFDRISSGKTELILVAGCSGIGKTAIIQELYKPIVRQHGYFIKGKYDQFQQNIPFSGFVQACRDLIGQLMAESDRHLQNWKTEILTVVGENGQVLIDVIPELERIIGKQQPAIELSGVAAQNRFNLLIQKFVRVFTTAAHPLVLFLDDLQWADLASLNLLKLLIEDSEYLAILGAYRNSEVSAVHPLMLKVDEIRKSEIAVNTLTLHPLRLPDLNRLVADTLNCSLKLAEPLTELVFQKTKGNPFFATQFLKSLYEDGSISFVCDRSPDYSVVGDSRKILGCGWQCDLAKIEGSAVTDDVVEFMVLQLRKLPLDTQNVLKLAACIGAEFDLKTLSIVCQSSLADTATSLWRGLQESFLIPKTEIYKFFTHSELNLVEDRAVNPTYRFLHDRIQQAAYSLIPEEQKQVTHLKIGRLLQENEGATEKIFDIINHLNRGRELITQPEERAALAQFNLVAGRKARNATAYAAANTFLQTGIELLTNNCWQSQYELTLNLHIDAAETAYLNGDLDGMEQIVIVVLTKAQTVLDKVRIYEIQLAAQTAQSQMGKAIEVGRIALGALGVELPEVPDNAKIEAAIQHIHTQLAGRQIADLIELKASNDAAEPTLSELHNRAAIKLLTDLCGPIYMRMPSLLPHLSTTIVSRALAFAPVPASALGYQIHGTILYHILGEERVGYEFCKLGMNLLDLFNDREFRSTMLFRFGGWMQHHQEAVRKSILTLKEAYLCGRETGDFLYSSYSIVNYFHNNFLGGVKLDEWEPELSGYSHTLMRSKQDSALIYLSLTWQTLLNFRTLAPQPDCLSGTAYDERIGMPLHHQNDDYSAIAIAYFYKLLLAYSFGKYTGAVSYIAKAQPYMMSLFGLFFVPVFHFYAALALLALLPSQLKWEQDEILAQVEIHQAALLHFSQNAPMNHLHKWHLVEAERQRAVGDKLAAIEHYDLAISLAKTERFLNEEALANELTARFYWQWGKEKVAQVYMTEAYYCYIRWGATAKVDDLRIRYPQLLNPILEPAQVAVSFAEMTTVGNSTGDRADYLDLATLLQVSQTVASELDLDLLLKVLLDIVITNAGADKCVLLLQSSSELEAVAVVGVDAQPQLFPAISLADSRDLPMSMVNTVKHNLTPLVLADARIYSQFAGDRYIATHRPKSVLCFPMLDRGKLIGIFYLENNSLVGAFTQDRVKLLARICAQAAISIENARRYRQSQQAVIDLTIELESRN